MYYLKFNEITIETEMYLRKIIHYFDEKYNFLFLGIYLYS